MTRCFSCRLLCILVLSASWPAIAESKTAPPPASNHDALYRWCHSAVIVKYGRKAPTDARPQRMLLNSRRAVELSDLCVRNGGRSY